MAIRGVRPKPSALRIVDGTHRDDRHGLLADALQATSGVNGLTRPASLKGDVRKAWDKYIAPAAWIDAPREPSAIAFCYLWAEFTRAPDMFQSARHTQMRGYMSELGLTDERNRAAPEKKAKSAADEYF